MKKILIIDDDSTLLKAYQEMLFKEEVVVTGALTGLEGLARVKQEKPDIIILDVMLSGGLNGFDVLEQLKKEADTKNIPVIMLTNLDSEEKVAKDIGVKEYIVKANTTKDEVVAMIMNCLHTPPASETPLP